MNTKDLPRGVRNCNPLNIEHNDANDWYGQIGKDDRPDGRAYCIFEFPWQGYRAAFKLLENYQKNSLAADGSKIDTVAEIIQRWAPRLPSGTENPHQAEYITFVRRRMGIEKGAHIDCGCWDTAMKLVAAMAQFETGMEKPFGSLTQKAMERGAREAGILPANDSIGKNADMKATKRVGGTAAVAAAATAAAPAVPLADLGRFAPLVQKAIEIAPWLIVGLFVLGAGYIGYRLWRRHQFGV